MNRVHDGLENLEVGHRKLGSLDNKRFANSKNGWARRMRFAEKTPIFSNFNEALKVWN